MSMYLRRAVSLRNSISNALHRSSTIGARNISGKLLSNSGCRESAVLPPFHFINDSRRGYAKGKKSKDNSGGDTIQVMPDIGPTVKATAASQMDAAIIALSGELTKLRTGRASPGMLDHIIVETEGVKLALNRLAVVSVIDSKTLSVNPYDPNTVKALERAIVSSPLGLNPRVDGERLIAPIPALTKEHIQAMGKVVAKSCEDVKQSIRRARQKALETIKKGTSSFSKDDLKKLEKEIEELTKKYVKSAEDMCKTKEKEISQG
ncbi:uncharacterized protein [Euphorbia lathyris]|uniref:uncharacterized protein n=1 Tax=Euphorbia lathyris TaxID=212925 RepID=UPI00331382DD